MKYFLFYDSILFLKATIAKNPRSIVAIIIPHWPIVGIITIAPEGGSGVGVGVGVALGVGVAVGVGSPFRHSSSKSSQQSWKLLQTSSQKQEAGPEHGSKHTPSHDDWQGGGPPPALDSEVEIKNKEQIIPNIKNILSILIHTPSNSNKTNSMNLYHL